MTNIKILRAKNEMSLRMLADKLNISIQSVIASEKHCSIELAYRYADLFGVSVFEVLGNDLFRIVPNTDEQKRYVLSLLNREV